MAKRFCSIAPRCDRMSWERKRERKPLRVRSISRALSTTLPPVGLPSFCLKMFQKLFTFYYYFVASYLGTAAFYSGQE